MAISRSIQRVEIRLAVAATLFAAIAVPAWSAEVLDTRLGVHGEYTRIVFELDAPAGYQIQRTETNGTAELLVSLDAKANPKSLASDKSDIIDSVEVRSGDGASTARIRLKSSKVRFKEMILANPARIVLDIMPSETIATSTPAPKAVASAPKIAAKAAAKPVASAAKPVAAAPLPIPDLSTPAPAIEKVVAKQVDKATDLNPSETEEPSVQEFVPAAPAPGTIAPAIPSAVPQKLAMAPKSMPANPGVPAGVPAATPAPRPEPRPLPRAPRKLPPVPAAAPPPAADSGSSIFGLDPTTMGLAAVGLVGLVAAGGLMMRRRGREEEVDFDSNPLADDPFSGFDDAPPGASNADLHAAATEMVNVDDADLPAPITDDAPVAKGLSTPGTSRLAPVAPTSVDSKPESFEAQASGDDDVFGSAVTEVGLPVAEAVKAAGSNSASEAASTVVMNVPDFSGNDDDTMVEVAPVRDPNAETFSNFDAVSKFTPKAAVAAASSPAEVQELERRLASAETRLDEALESAERMERKIAAQTEELRVQRAAIARTQRAVRNLTRPGEDTSATEPALRDPNKKGGSPD